MTGPGPAALAGRRTVVTGAGSGIGAAMARRFAAQGAHVVVNDLDPVSARAVAAEVGGVAVPGDAASADGVAALVSAAREHLGGIDLFCANAGVTGPPGLEADDAGWAATWDVNVMAHVRAARLLVPPWVAAGGGHLLVTVSAAGLLTMPGAAAYSATKHAALAFAEWLAISYADAGIRVQALCPQGVRTPLLASTGAVGEAVLGAAAISPEQVADRVVEELDGGRFLILPHPEVARYAARRGADPDGWQAGMRRMIAGLTPPR